MLTYVVTVASKPRSKPSKVYHILKEDSYQYFGEVLCGVELWDDDTVHKSRPRGKRICKNCQRVARARKG